MKFIAPPSKIDRREHDGMLAGASGANWLRSVYADTESSPPASNRPNPKAGSETDVENAFLDFYVGCGSRLCWKLKNCCFLTSEHVSQQHGLLVWKLQGIMMGWPGLSLLICPRKIAVL